MAAATGRDAGPHQQHRVRVETEAGAVQGVREGPDHHTEDHRHDKYQQQDNSSLAPGEELLESEYLVFLLNMAEQRGRMFHSDIVLLTSDTV